jgi:hypothetical protein
MHHSSPVSMGNTELGIAPTSPPPHNVSTVPIAMAALTTMPIATLTSAPAVPSLNAAFDVAEGADPALTLLAVLCETADVLKPEPGPDEI